jgi:hypothetical protein
MRFIVHKPLAMWLGGAATQTATVTMLLTVWAATASAEAAQPDMSGGCASVNAGALNVELETGQKVTRQVKLSRGEFLNISTNSRADTSAAVSLVSGAGAPLKVLSGDADGVGGFTARNSGTYVFSLAAGEAGPATVTATCSAMQDAAIDQSFLQRRHDLLTSREPDRIRIDGQPVVEAKPGQPIPQSIERDEQGRPKRLEFSVSWSELAAAAAPLKKTDKSGVFDFWLEGRYENYETATDYGASDGNLGVVYLGTKYMVTPNIMVGTLTQFDQAGEVEALTGEHVSADGWMVGPFVSMKLAPGIVFDGRAGWGQSVNAVNQIEGQDETTARRLVRGKLTSTHDVNGWKVAPSVGISYVEDALPDVITTASGETAKGVGRVDVLPEISRRYTISSSTYVEPRAALGAFWDFNDLGHVATPSFGATTDVHMKAEAGVALGIKDGTTLQAMGGVETGGEAAPNDWTGRLQLNMPLGNGN